jgi:PAS domain S-box-containing protein
MNVLQNMGQVKHVHQIMTSTLVMLPQHCKLSEAAALMETESVSSLLLEENGEPVGILTERDILRALGQNISLQSPASSLMTRELISVSINETIHSAFHCMVLNAIRHLVVIDGNRKAVGILSETDFRKSRSVENFIGAIDVGRAMSQSYVGVLGDFCVVDVARLMQKHKASCAIVVIDECPVGLVTERDMVRLFRSGASHHLMREVMTSPVSTATRDLLLVDAVRHMQQLKIRRLVVVDSVNRLCGILNEHDVVRHLEDEYVQMLQQLVVQQAQALNDDKFRAVVDTVPDKIMLKDINSTYVSCNSSYASDLGIRPEDIVGKSDFDFFPSDLSIQYRADDKKVMDQGIAITIEEPYSKNGEQIWIRTTKAPMRDELGVIKGVVVVFHDISDQRSSMEKLQHRTWALEALSKCNDSILHAHTEETMWNDVCVAITSSARYPLTWVGWVENDTDKNIRLLAAAGLAQSAIMGFHLTWADDGHDENIPGLAIRSKQTQVIEDISLLPNTDYWSPSHLEYKLASFLALPIFIDRNVSGVLVVYSDMVRGFDEEVTQLFRKMVDNISFGVSALRKKVDYVDMLENQRVQSIKLEHSLESALSAIAATLEQRDPYTAGHQKNVADLAMLIGKQLGLDESRLKGLYLASIVHDLGKIQIPAEILTKPGRLIPAEFALVKLHPEVGYNILKTIDFPWPIADIVRQHHEYLDGSGYPLGLKGDQILFEAKILTVADIVESMSADRPYRPALGIGQAVVELGRLSGIRLDSSVVQACVAVLQRGEFTPSQLQLAQEM